MSEELPAKIIIRRKSKDGLPIPQFLKDGTANPEWFTAPWEEQILLGKFAHLKKAPEDIE